MNPTLPTTLSRGLHGQLVEQLGHAIVTGRYAPGDSVTPDGVSESYNVSRTVVREALRSLESKGLINARPNVGTRVREPADWNLFDADVMRWLRQPESDDRLRRDLAEFTAHLAPLAVALAGNVLVERLLRVVGAPPIAQPPPDTEQIRQPGPADAQQQHTDEPATPAASVGESAGTYVDFERLGAPA